MLKTVLYALAGLLLLAGCAGVSPAIDEKTGTSLAERCANYRSLLAAAKVLQATDPSDGRATRIALYEVALAACPTLPPPPKTTQ